MFSSKKRLQKRTTSKDLNRPDYLQALVTEFQETTCQNSKEQVLANLANFAYDPINFNYLRDLHVIDLFIDCIETDEDLNGKIVEFGISGLCNAVSDIKNRKIVNDHQRSIYLITNCLSSSNEETVLSAITTLMQLIDDESRPRIVTPALVDCMRRFTLTSNRRFQNLAHLFLTDYCKPDDLSAINQSNSFLHIPLPQ